MRKISIEQAQALLKKLDSGMPERFTVTGVAYRKSSDTYYIRWFDEAEKDVYDDGVAQMRAAGAKAAYSFTPTCSFSALWFNESAEDPNVMAPVAEILDPKEVAAIAKEPGELIFMDIA